MMSEVEREIDRVIVEIDGKHHQREICNQDFHDIKKDRAGR
jgi:very-short-patch-repair endonuclease